MKLKIKKANKFYLVENDTTSTDSSVGTSNNDDIFTIKDTDSKFLQNFKEYCKSAVSNAEQPSENNPENASIAPGSNPSGKSKDPIGDAAEGVARTAAEMAEDNVINPNEGN